MTAEQTVILLHGLARTRRSMAPLASAFADAGYHVVNVGYPSRRHPIEALAPLAIENGLSNALANGPIHFVTHSLGGILVRCYLASNKIERLGRVVMLAPPNQGSELVDVLRYWPGFAWFNGPAGRQLGTRKDSITWNLGAVAYEVGVIAGTKSINPLLSQYLMSPNDGKVWLERTKVSGMTDFVSVPHSHPFIMRAPRVIRQSIAFIQNGKFDQVH